MTGLPESVFVIAEIFGNKNRIEAAYIPPHYDKTQFLLESERELEQLSKNPIILAGVFNIENLQSDNLTSSYLCLSKRNHFEVITTKIKRSNKTSQTRLDHFLVRNAYSLEIKVMEVE